MRWCGGLIFGAAMALVAAHSYARAAPARSAARASELVYIGTWGTEAPPPSGTEGAKPVRANGPVGIYAARLSEKTGDLTLLGLQIPLQRADALAINPKVPVLYPVAASASNPRADTDVYAFRIDAASGPLSLLGKVSS